MPQDSIIASKKKQTKCNELVEAILNQELINNYSDETIMSLILLTNRDEYRAHDSFIVFKKQILFR